MNLNRTFIFGGTGSGKTTLAMKMSTILKIPFYTTDNFVYKKTGWSEKYPEKVRDKNLKIAFSKKKWIIEGVHKGEWIYPAFKKSTYVVILIMPRHKTLKRVIVREIQRLIKREREKTKLRDFWMLLKLAYAYKNDYFLSHQQLVKDFKKEFIILHSNKEILAFLTKMGDIK